ncbi:GSCFA domain-containing protein [bacterium]|nr:GSCFA domain-containing protein [bacterium]
MKFRTEISISPFSFGINYHTPVLLLGSCFAGNMGHKLQQFRIPATINPHGIIFNPVSLAQIIQNSVENGFAAHNLTFEQSGIFKNYLFHSEVSAKSANALELHLGQLNEQLRQAIETSQVVFITLGTAWIYTHLATQQVVANCHKQPASLFEKRLLNLSEINQALKTIVEYVQKLGNARVVFTVSPVRHIKDGIVENQLSKSLLLAAVHEQIALCEACHYFPAYEIMMDDLRDYRFYEKDLIHPNEMAIDYIWERFGQAFFSNETHQINQQIARLNAALQHRMLGGNKAEIEKFVKASIALCEAIESKGLLLQSEKAYFNSLLAK